MPVIQIVAVDPFDDALFEEWHAAYLLGDRHGREEWASPWRLAEMRAEHQSVVRYVDRERWALQVDGEVVAAAAVYYPLLENVDLAELDLHTHPEHRRRGHGTRLLAHVEQSIRDRNRSTIVTESAFPHDGPPDGAGSPGPEFLRRHGFTLALGDVLRAVDLPVDTAVLERLAAEAVPHHADYRLRSFAGPVPEDLAEEFAEVTAALRTDAPMGDLDLEPDIPSVASMREAEGVLARQGRTKYNTVAIAADGAVAAYTELVMSAHDTGRVYQWGTLVRRAHRGHRLGLATKVANLAFLQGLRPDAKTLITCNAEVNRHMIAVNEALGFVPRERSGEFQKKL